MIVSPIPTSALQLVPRGHKAGDQPLAAIVTCVHDDRLVNVAVFQANGLPHPAPHTNVRLIQAGDGIPADGPYCVWPPALVTK